MRNKKISATLALIAGITAIGTVTPVFAADGDATSVGDGSVTGSGIATAGAPATIDSEAGVGFEAGDLTFTSAPNLDFGMHTLFQATSFDLLHDVSDKTRILAVNDQSAGAGWNITAAMTTFKDGSKILNPDTTHLTINANNAAVLYQLPAGTDWLGSGDTGYPTNTNSLPANGSAVVIPYTDGATTGTPAKADAHSAAIFTADTATDATNGKGKYALDFNAKNSAGLVVGADTQQVGTFTSTITWTLTSGPTAPSSAA